MLDVEISYDSKAVDYAQIADTLRLVGMAYFTPMEHARAFAASFVTVFVFHQGALIGFGRALSDGVYQAALYDVAVLPEYQGQGIGSLIIHSLLDKLGQCNVILYAAPGKEDFYTALGFRRMKTGMALFTNTERMAEKGFTE
nr:GNAT family N-acetyltransferase [uncultured Desulfobulbus sp.]